MADIEPWGIWHSKALAAGVGAALASLGRAVIRDYWQHGRGHDMRAGEGSYLGADQHHAMMIALAKQKPALAKACFAEALAIGAPGEEETQAVARNAEELYADNGIQRHSPQWYEHVYSLDGCVWALHVDILSPASTEIMNG